MRPPRIYAATAVALLAVGAAAVQTGHAATSACPPRVASSAYSSFVARAVDSNTDLWGSKLLAQRGGPTYEAARGLLAPLTRGVQWGATLTASGVVLRAALVPVHARTARPSSRCTSPTAARSSRGGSAGRRSRSTSATGTRSTGRARRASRRQSSPTATCRSCRRRTRTQAVCSYHQESFVGRAYGKKYGARSVISFVRLDVDATHAKRDAIVRLVPWKLLAHSAPDRLADKGQTRLIVSAGAQFAHGVARYRRPRRARRRRSTSTG